MVTPRLVLIGPPGAGKTTIGRRVAGELGTTFIDTDELVVQRAGMSVADIFLERGEPAFRELEAQAVADALGLDAVVALGGGAPMHPLTQERLAGHAVCFLEVRIADAAGRIGFDGARPLLAINPRATWTRLMGERRETYQRLATFTVDTAGRSVDEVTADVVAKLSVPQS